MRSQRPAFAFVFVTVMLDMLGFGIVAPVLPALIASITHGGAGRTSEYMGLFVAVWALMQFVCSPILGVLSDRFGRRPIILFSTFGLGLDYILMALAPNTAWLLAGRILSGISSSTMATANAYVADITPPADRARAFGWLGGALGLGFVLGPALGGWMGAHSLRRPFWFCAALSLANAAYGFFLLPESLPPDRRSHRIAWRAANPIGSLRLVRSSPTVFALAIMITLNYLAHEAYTTVFVLYAIYRFGWSEQTIGLSLAVVAVSYMLATAGLVAPSVRHFGERHTVFAGLLLGGVGFVLYGLAPTGLIFLPAMAVQALWGLALPPAQALLTHHIHPSQQGHLQGAISSLRGIAMIAGPGLFAAIFAVAIARRPPLPGAPWFLAALLVFASLLLGLARVPRASPERSPADIC